MKKIIAMFLVLIFLASCSNVSTEPPEESSKPETGAETSTEMSTETAAEASGAASSEESAESTAGTSESSLASSTASSEAKASSSAAALSADDFAKNYYTDLTGELNADFYAKNTILDGMVLEPDKAVEVYGLQLGKYEIWAEESGFNNFISDYKSEKKLWDMTESREYYYVPGLKDGEESTAGIMRRANGSFDAMLSLYPSGAKFPTSQKLLKKIYALYDPAKTEARYVNMAPRIMGILLSDGTQEHLIVLSSAYEAADVIRVNEIYPVSEVIDALETIGYP